MLVSDGLLFSHFPLSFAVIRCKNTFFLSWAELSHTLFSQQWIFRWFFLCESEKKSCDFLSQNEWFYILLINKLLLPKHYSVLSELFLRDSWFFLRWIFRWFFWANRKKKLWFFVPEQSISYTTPMWTKDTRHEHNGFSK